MRSKNYYGEYSLKHWIDLLCSESIKLPSYQRNYVWTEEQVKSFINSIKNGQFIQPVTIAAYTENSSSFINYIVDGQQRLTSLLLAYFKKFPKIESKKQHYASSNDDNDDDDEKFFEFQFTDLLNTTNTSTLNNEQKYKDLSLDIEDDFWENNCLGFTYIVPQSESSNDDLQSFLCAMFKNINSSGVSLTNIERRRSLYFLDKTKSSFFDTEVLKHYTIQNYLIDFVRYAAYCSQYKKCQEYTKLAKGYNPISKKDEQYFEDYIYSAIDKKYEYFCDFDECFPNDDFESKFNILKESLSRIIPRDKQNFESIIDCDLYFFGTIYFVLFEGKLIDSTKSKDISERIESKIKEFKENSNHSKSPNRITNVRHRFEQSINIYKDFLQE